MNRFSSIVFAFIVILIGVWNKKYHFIYYHGYFCNKLLGVAQAKTFKIKIYYLYRANK